MKDETNRALVRHEVCEVPTTLPAERIEFAQGAAKSLMKIVSEQGLSHNFGGSKDHLYYEAWNTIAEFYGYALGADQSEPIGEANDKGQFVGFTARGYVRRKSDGVILATAESSCMRDEGNWKSKANYQLRSMAQTRAASKAARMLLSWVVVLAGYSPTPAEEMGDPVEADYQVEPDPEEPTIIKAQFVMEQWASDHNVDLADYAHLICGQGTYKGGKNKGKPFDRYKVPVSLFENGPPATTPEDEALAEEEEVPFDMDDSPEATGSDPTGGNPLDSDVVEPGSAEMKKLRQRILIIYDDLEAAGDWLKLKHQVSLSEPMGREKYDKVMADLGKLSGNK